MSIEDLDVIDFVSIDAAQNVVLTISDHLDWDDKNLHLIKLQNKLNRYLDAIENESLYESYPNAKGKGIIIRVVSKYLPNAAGDFFLQQSRKVIEAAGYGFRFENLI